MYSSVGTDLACEPTSVKTTDVYTNRQRLVSLSQMANYPFYHPTGGRRLSCARHCNNGAQHVPKAVYRSGVNDEHTTSDIGIKTWVPAHHS